MKEKVIKTNIESRTDSNGEKNNLQGYPLYPDSEDIYKISHEEKDFNHEDIFKN